jgi:murein DD-endopeptidase MepM/ murein hydrolase activator NlpD
MGGYGQNVYLKFIHTAKIGVFINNDLKVTLLEGWIIRFSQPIFVAMRKSILTVLWICLTTASFGQVESAIELMEDSLHWLNHCTTLITEPSEEEEDSIIQVSLLQPAQLVSEVDLNLFDHIYTFEAAPPIELNMSTFEDSLDIIPGYDMDDRWDTKMIHQVEELEWEMDTVAFLLAMDSCDFTFPTQYPRITSPFGPRWGRTHKGLDLGLRTGEPVVSAFEGMVRISHFSPSYGNVVVIRHKNGLETLYAHMEARFVQPGQWIQNGQIIGLGGNTGRSFGAHLHFEIRFKGNAIDPALILNVSQAQIKSPLFYLTKTNAKVPAPSSSSKGKAKNGKYHTVKRGETLSSVARKHGTSVSKLCKLNKLRPSSKLRVGQKVRVR